MSKIGEYRFPTITLTQAIEVADLIIRQFRGSITTSGLAEGLGMSEKGGGFLHKMAALREYGLVEGRGELRTTELAERIVLPDSAADGAKAAVDAFIGVELFAEVELRLGNEVPEVERLAILLGEITRDRIQSRKKAQTIRRIYADYVPYLRKAQAAGVLDDEDAPPVAVGSERATPLSASSPPMASPIEFKAGNMQLSLPLTAASLDIVESALAVIRRQLAEDDSTTSAVREDEGPEETP